MEPKDTRSELLRIGTELINQGGYHATGIDAVLKLAGVPKGSFYHHFKSKEDFGLEVIDQFTERLEQNLALFLGEEGVPPLERIRNFLENRTARLAQNHFTRGCLIGNLGQEMADLNERFRERLEGAFEMWQRRLAACLQEAQRRGDLPKDLDPHLTAGFILSSFQGALLRAKTTKSLQPMQDFTKVIFEVVLHRCGESGGAAPFRPDRA